MLDHDELLSPFVKIVSLALRSTCFPHDDYLTPLCLDYRMTVCDVVMIMLAMRPETGIPISQRKNNKLKLKEAETCGERGSGGS